MSPRSRVRIPCCQRMECHTRTSPTRERGLTFRSLRSPRLRVGLVCVMFFVSPCVVRAADPKPISDGFQQVEKMSDLERGRVQRNLAEFQKLTAEQQAHYRDLHVKLEENKTTGGSLSSLLQEYSAWLTTLTPSQRDDLNKETVPAKKLALVRQFKEAQEYRPEPTPNEPHDAPLADLRNIRQRMMPFGGPLLSRPELAAVMKVIAKDAGLDSEKTDNGSAPKYYRELLKGSIEKTPGDPRDWPSPDLQRKIEQAVDRSDLRSLINRRPETKREMLIRVLLGSISNLAFEELKPSFPTEQDKQKVLESLDREERERITRMPREEGDRQLAMLHFKSRGDDVPKRMNEFLRQMQQLSTELGVPIRPPLPPGGDGPRPGPFPARDGMSEGPEGGRPGDRFRKGSGPDRPRRNENEEPR